MFSRFQSLPTELRLQIWREAMPPSLEKPLYFYKKGCWQPHRLTEGDNGYYPDNEELHLEMSFFHDRLDPLHLDVPLYSVSHEARRFALEWIARQGLETRFDDEHQSIFLIRPFDPQSSVLYVPKITWIEFLCEESYRLFDEDLLGRSVGCNIAPITCLAVPHDVIIDESDGVLAELLDEYRIYKIFVLLGAQSDGTWQDLKDVKPQEGWELETDVQWPIFSWTFDSKSFQWGKAERNISEYPLFDRLQKSNSKLSAKLLDKRQERFDIVPAVAVRN
ncbi:hypothetical protein N7478_011917 [Penicillium angulare]|uniref:uncharacterized protein n=1 Tax=Penicillium angulare TaxID=116970 RepID=UPI002541C7D3|nr:uncharacterized protein N7478_011917 [Penicillium angulare]KAJ5261322.1 hypothetical protein N7478_011917 [Penicillium angulare]